MLTLTRVLENGTQTVHIDADALSAILLGTYQNIGIYLADASQSQRDPRVNEFPCAKRVNLQKARSEAELLLAILDREILKEYE